MRGFIDMGTYENMLEYYHGMCRELCVKWDIVCISSIILIRKVFTNKY